MRNLNLSYYFLCRICAEVATDSRTRLYQKFDTWTVSFWWKVGMFRLTGTGQSCLGSSFGHSSYGTYQSPSCRRWASHESLFILSLKEWRKPPLVLMLCHVIWFLKPTFISANFKSAFFQGLLSLVIFLLPSLLPCCPWNTSWPWLILQSLS
jgi:hypothetical protein